MIAAVTFCAFGVSDIVEVETGAWWRPWWLLVWKGLCIVVLLVLLWQHYRAGKRTKEPGSGLIGG